METMFGQLLAMNNDVVITIVMMLILGLRQTRRNAAVKSFCT